MKTLEEEKSAVIEEFGMFDEWLDKYEYLIELGKNLEAFPVELKTEDIKHWRMREYRFLAIMAFIALKILCKV